MKRNRVRTFCGKTPNKSLCACAPISHADKAVSQASWDRCAASRVQESTANRSVSKDSDWDFLETVLGRLLDEKDIETKEAT
ncbi:hypothetical protein BCS91_26280 (plasmid) [Vibrio cyclitrophicus]